MTVGETLTEARNQAGLSVDELSERTRIRSTVIRSIEQDDYAACGGELYVRGYVRAIAGAVGIDALPLIREFDQAQLGGFHQPLPGGGGAVEVPHAADVPAAHHPDATRFDLPAVAGDPDATRLELPAVASELDATRFDLPVVPAFDSLAAQGAPADPDATRFDLPLIPGLSAGAAPFDAAGFDPGAPFGGTAPVGTAPFAELPPGALPLATFPAARRPPAAAQPRNSADTRFDLSPVSDDLMAAGYQVPESQTQVWPAPPWPSAAAPAQTPPTAFPPASADGGRSGRHRGIAYTAVAAVVAVALGVLAIRLATSGGPSHSAAAATASPRASAAANAASASASAAAKASAAAQASAAAKASKSAAKATAPVLLPIAAARAFGPDGFADGDNPSLAGYTIAANPAEIWSTQWYATPEFGMLKHGTGLLLDLGSQRTITSVRFDLTQYRGANLQIKVGNGTTPQALRVAASEQGASGVVRIALPNPEVARYLVIWFTLLAPDGAGHYQESVSHVTIAGQR